MPLKAFINERPNKYNDVGKNNASCDNEEICYWCGRKGHWSRTCGTKMFRKPLPSIQERKKIEANLVDLTHLNVYDFFEDT